ncbi:hypothetical protein EDB80DRAFT_687227 [Ilyonectria destructans]|nr:hypothetical protein EDB80DRAFT_687227 [Ilyonectria destructans]
MYQCQDPDIRRCRMNPLAHPAFEQLPPLWDYWLNVVRLIAKYGASVFEVVRGRTLAGLNVERSGHPSRTLEFLQFLAAEDSVQLDVVSGHPSWSALCNALRCEVEAVDALRLLSSAGVVLNRISDDGGTALHMAARMCVNTGAIDYLCENGCGRYIDRPDQLGWTPFHYAVVARSSAGGNAPFARVVALLRRGADPSIRVVENALQMYDQPSGRSTALELLKHARPERFDLLIGVLTHAGIAMPLERFANCP